MGCSADPERRLGEHNRGQTAATRGGVPWLMVHREAFASLAEAVRRERYLKSGRGRGELDQRLG